ncbi:hypothetical protein EUX98_g5521 [Antrodiella citrinella]|uniref:Uncharacterized protein n=1 Tax=Antrodiella citrinella TaxID=2447956 RepID=A0A4S4MS85_9APHY|nr:hypothetical protein EUX98_g5521 [Antrodiella citrinella]
MPLTSTFTFRTTLLSLLVTYLKLYRFSSASVEHRPEFYVQTGTVAQDATELRDDSDFNDEDELWSPTSPTSTTGSSVVPSPHEVSKLEAVFYYTGLSPNSKGPKLVYRTSSDEFVVPDGPEAYKRLMKLVYVDEDHELGKDGLWDIIRDQIVDLLTSKDITFSSVDLVCFTWLNKDNDQGEHEVDDDSKDDSSQDDDSSLNYEDFPAIKPVEDGTRYITPATVWIGVLPDTLDAELAHESALQILEIFKPHNIVDVDVAFRESVAQLSHGGPALFGPVGDLDALKDLIDNVSTPLSLPIAGLKTIMQGTLGFYFRVGNDLYAVTARHVLFKDNENNNQYRYVVGPKKEVIVMAPPAFDNYVASIQTRVSTLNDSVIYLQQRAASYERKRADAEEGGPEALQYAQDLEDTKRELIRTRANAEKLKVFFKNIMTKWRKPKDRIIGYVDWSPPIGIAVPPHRYTKDLCVIKLHKKKFKNFIGNVLSLGPDISREKFKALMYDRTDVPSEFRYPEEGLLPVQGMLTAAEINNPNSKNIEGERIRRVIKRGTTTLTTVGTLSKFMSHVRKYSLYGHMDSIEVAILPHDNDSGPFSRGGDSGSLVVDARRRFAALLTGGTGNTDSSDITYATLMEWVWVVIKDEYEGANLYCEDLKAFLADVATA